MNKKKTLLYWKVWSSQDYVYFCDVLKYFLKLKVCFAIHGPEFSVPHARYPCTADLSNEVKDVYMILVSQNFRQYS